MDAFAGFRRPANALPVLALAATLALAACTKPPEPPAAAAEVYAMRGEIVRLPKPESPEIAIRHEAVPDFRDEAGKVVGMEAMTMPFALAPEVEIAGFAPGDRVAFTLEMRWNATRDIVRISRIEKLPAGTLLSWETPPSTAQVPAPANTGGQPQ